MWKRKLKSLLPLLLVVFCFTQQALALPSSSAKSEKQEVLIDLSEFLGTENILEPEFMKDSNSELGKQKDLKKQSEESKETLMDASTLLNNQDLLLDNLEAQWMELELQVQALEIQSDSLKQDNQKLKNMLESSKTTIVDLRKNLDEYIVALKSNKEDTGYIVGLFAEAQGEIDKLKEYIVQLEASRTKLKNARITAGILAGAGIGMFFCADLIQDNDKIKAALKGCGIGVAVSGGILLGVSFIF